MMLDTRMDKFPSLIAMDIIVSISLRNKFDTMNILDINRASGIRINRFVVNRRTVCDSIRDFVYSPQSISGDAVVL